MTKNSVTRMTLIERSTLTFQSYLNSDYGKRFYTDEFLSGISRTRSEIHASLSKSVGTLVLLTLVIAYYEFLPPKIVLLGNEITLSRSFLPTINLLLSISLFVVTTKYIEVITIDAYINKIGNNLSIFSFNLFLLDKNPPNIWVEPLTPRYFGIKSGLGHKIILPIFLISSQLISYTLLFLLYYMIATTSISTFSATSSSTTTKVISVIPLFFCFISFCILIVFSIRYNFFEAEFDEYTLKPTATMEDALKSEIVTTNQQTPEDKLA